MISTGRRVTSPPARRRPGRRGQLDHPVEQLEAAVLVEVGGDAEHDVGLARLGAHRGQVGERRGERLARRSARRPARVAAEMDALDERVDRGRGGAAGDGDRGVVAGAEPHPAARRPAAARAPAPAARTRPSRAIVTASVTAVVTKVRTDVERRQPLLHRIGEAGARFGTRPPRSKRVRLAIQLGDRAPRLRLPGPHRRRPVVGDPGQGRPLPRPLADPGLRRPARLLRAQRARLGPDPALPRLPDRASAGRRSPGASRCSPATCPAASSTCSAGCCSPSGSGVPRRITVASIVYEQAISADLGDHLRRLLLHRPPRPRGAAAALGLPAADPARDRAAPPAGLRPARQSRPARLRPRAAAGGDLDARGDRRCSSSTSSTGA